jgi:hypothetical protein
MSEMMDYKFDDLLMNYEKYKHTRRYLFERFGYCVEGPPDMYEMSQMLKQADCDEDFVNLMDCTDDEFMKDFIKTKRMEWLMND